MILSSEHHDRAIQHTDNAKPLRLLHFYSIISNKISFILMLTSTANLRSMISGKIFFDSLQLTLHNLNSMGSGPSGKYSPHWGCNYLNKLIIPNYTLSSAWNLHNIIIKLTFSVSIISQKSSYVFGRGPWVAMKALLSSFRDD